MSKSDELVLCKYVGDQKFKPDMKFLHDNDINFSWMRRGDCETDPRYKQVIPYVIYYDIAKDAYLSYYRKAGDGRLLGSLSIGVGGHINPCDSSTKQITSINPVVLNNINRELAEELGILYIKSWDWWLYFRGFIYDNDNEVGKVHVGLTFLKPIQLSTEFNFEDTEHIFKVMPYDQLRKEYNNLETWSKIAFDVLVQQQRSDKFFRPMESN